MKKAISIFVILALVSVGYFIYSSSNNQGLDSNIDKKANNTTTSPLNINDTNKEVITEENEEIPSNWKTLTNNDYSLKYPIEATAEERDGESQVYFMGQKQIDSGRTQTELFDGYSFRVGNIVGVPTNDLKQLAMKERDNADQNCNYENGKVSDLTAIKVGDQEAFQYSAEGCYVDYKETIVNFDGNFYRISQSYFGDTEDYEGYKDITNKILTTLEFSN